MTISQVTVDGTFRRPDGSPSTGYVLFQLSSELSDGSSMFVTNASPQVAQLVNGSFSTTLYATTEATTQPNNASYTITLDLDGEKYVETGLALNASPTTLNLAAWMNFNGGTNPGGATNIAGGDLQGSYPNPTLRAINGVIINGKPTANNQALITTNGGADVSWQAIPLLDTTSTDIQPLGTQAAGSTGKSADAGHVHPTTGLITTANAMAVSGTSSANSVLAATGANAASWTNNLSLSAITLSGTLTTNTVTSASGQALVLNGYTAVDFNYNNGSTGSLQYFAGGTSAVWAVDNVGNMTIAGTLNVISYIQSSNSNFIFKDKNGNNYFAGYSNGTGGGTNIYSIVGGAPRNYLDDGSGNIIVAGKVNLPNSTYIQSDGSGNIYNFAKTGQTVYLISPASNGTTAIGLGVTANKVITLGAGGTAINTLDDGSGNLYTHGVVGSNSTSATVPQFALQAAVSGASSFGGNLGLGLDTQPGAGKYRMILNSGTGGILTASAGTVYNKLDDGAGNMVVSGQLTADHYVSGYTQITASTSGFAFAAQPFQGYAYKKVVVFFNAFNNTLTGMTWAFPAAFTSYTVVANNLNLSYTNSSVTLPSNGVAQTGIFIMEGA